MRPPSFFYWSFFQFQIFIKKGLKSCAARLISLALEPECFVLEKLLRSTIWMHLTLVSLITLEKEKKVKVIHLSQILWLYKRGKQSKYLLIKYD